MIYGHWEFVEASFEPKEKEDADTETQLAKVKAYEKDVNTLSHIKCTLLFQKKFHQNR